MLSYNIRHAENEAGQIDVRGVADFILKVQPDLVSLQEVDSVCNRSNHVDIAAELGKLTGMYFYFGKAINYDGGGYGLAFLSRLPVLAISTVSLPIQLNNKGEPRVLIEAVVQLTKDKTIKVLSTHLDHLEDETNRIMQARFIANRYKDEKLPFIISGDLNALFNSQPMQVLYSVATQPPLDKNMPTFPSGIPTKKIDYFLLSRNYSWQCTRFDVLEEKNISDHRPVIMEINMK
jgi:endonuclease/exonuclease/phosphatase family metal-dependent hydrolase